MIKLVVALNVVNYTLLSYMPTYLQRRIGLTTDEALVVPIIGMVFMMVFLPFAGHLSDRVGRRAMWRVSLLSLLVGVVPLYMLMATGLVGAIVGFVLLGLCYVPQLATISATFPLARGADSSWRSTCRSMPSTSFACGSGVPPSARFEASRKSTSWS